MDDLRNFDHTADYSAHDDAIEAPPSIGTDERRMHVRAYNHWVSLLHGEEYPSIEELDPAQLDDFGPHSVLLDFTSSAENPSIVYLGEKLRVECDLDDSIIDIAHVPPRSLLSRLTDHYMQILANRAPVGFEAEFVSQKGCETMYRGILMPFTSDGDSIDFIYGVINWKEMLDGAQSKQLFNAVDQILAQSPSPVVPQTAVWADGPGHIQPDVELSAANDQVTEAEAIETEVHETELTAPTPTAVVAHDEGAFEIEPDHDDEGAIAPLDESNDAAEPTDSALPFAPQGDETLVDWLIAARDAAQVAQTIEQRGHSALYRAVSLAYDFALIAEARPEDYATLLNATGLVEQERSPMTPIVKLVFGLEYDKTRLAEYAAVLGHAKTQAIPMDGLHAFIEAQEGGIKAVVKAYRAAKRPAKMAVPRSSTARDRARTITPQMVLNLPGEEEFVLLIARRVDGEHIGVIGAAEPDEALIERALNRMTV